VLLWTVHWENFLHPYAVASHVFHLMCLAEIGAHENIGKLALVPVEIKDVSAISF
jgi:hypothetical protein